MKYVLSCVRVCVIALPCLCALYKYATMDRPIRTGSPSHCTWPTKQLQTGSRLPFPGHRQAQASSAFSQFQRGLASEKLKKQPSKPESNEVDIAEVLAGAGLALENCQLFEDYVIHNVRYETLCKWLAKKQMLIQCENFVLESENVKSKRISTASSRQPTPKQTSSVFEVEADKTVKADKKVDFARLAEAVDTLQAQDLYKLTSMIATSTLATGFNLCIVGAPSNSLQHCIPALLPSDHNHKMSLMPTVEPALGRSVAAHVAYTLSPVLVDDVTMDDRFPVGTLAEDSVVISVMGVPIMLPNGHVIGVVEFYRAWQKTPFTNANLQLAQGLLEWASVAIHRAEASVALTQQKEISRSLFEAASTCLDKVKDIDLLVANIMRFAKSIVQADRCSLFLMEHAEDELHARVFEDEDEGGAGLGFKKASELRFSTDKGIAGFVAKNRCVVNVSDVYSDKRFNKDVDKITGYTTESILSIPIIGDGQVHGVVQLINKKGGGPFTRTDQDNFELFAVFAALALRYSKIYGVVEEGEWRLQVAREQFAYHSRIRDEEVDSLMELTSSDVDVPDDFYSATCSVMTCEGDKLMSHFIVMVRELLAADSDLLPPDSTLHRFVICVRHNYRQVAYHNFHHAMSVAHTLFCVLRQHPGTFTADERLALMVAGIGHDLDHSGLSNQFLQLVQHPLASLYRDSPNEQHHFALAAEIIERHDVFSALDDERRRSAIELVRSAIIATDPAVSFGAVDDLNAVLNDGQFDLAQPACRSNMIAVLMMACDLIGTTFDWKTARQTILNLHDEFWREGDRRRERGFPVAAMMDRNAESQFAESQVTFYTAVSVPCYETLSRVLPECADMEAAAKSNLSMWLDEARAAKRAQEEEARRRREWRRLEEENEACSRELMLASASGEWVVEESRIVVEEQKAEVKFAADRRGRPSQL